MTPALKNISTGKKIIGKVRIANSFFEKFKGLMFERVENFDYALVFPMAYESRLGTSVHMLFVFFPIDIVYLDSGKRVVDKARLVPWMVNYTPSRAAKYFIELPEGTAKETKIGNRLEWQ